MDLTFELHITSVRPEPVFSPANLWKRKSIVSRGLCRLRRRVLRSNFADPAQARTDLSRCARGSAQREAIGPGPASSPSRRLPLPPPRCGRQPSPGRGGPIGFCPGHTGRGRHRSPWEGRVSGGKWEGPALTRLTRPWLNPTPGKSHQKVTGVSGKPGRWAIRTQPLNVWGREGHPAARGHPGLSTLCSLPRSAGWSEGPAARGVRPPGTGCPSEAQPLPLKVAISCPSAELHRGWEAAGGPRTTRAGLPGGCEAGTQLGSPREWPRPRADTSAVGERGAQEVVLGGSHRGTPSGRVSASGLNPGQSPGARLCTEPVLGRWGVQACLPHPAHHRNGRHAPAPVPRVHRTQLLRGPGSPGDPVPALLSGRTLSRAPSGPSSLPPPGRARPSGLHEPVLFLILHVSTVIPDLVWPPSRHR